MLAQPASQNWQAYLHLAIQKHAKTSRLVPQKRYGPLTVQRPFYPESETCHVYLLHPPGGIVGGDQLEFKLEADKESESLITTPGATKFYRSAGEAALFKQTLALEQSSQVEFLPLENIYFTGAYVKADTHIQLTEGSELVFWETHCFGRPANNETFDEGDVTLRLTIEDDSGLLLTERQVVNALEIKRSTGLRGFSVMANMVIASNSINEALIEKLRALEFSSGFSGITQLNERLLIIRVLSESTRDIANYFQALWFIARPLTLNKQPCPPRIWQT